MKISIIIDIPEDKEIHDITDPFNIIITAPLDLFRRCFFFKKLVLHLKLMTKLL